MPKKRKTEVQTTQQTFDAWECYQERGRVPAKILQMDDDNSEKVMVLKAQGENGDRKSGRFCRKNVERKLGRGNQASSLR